MNRGTIFLGAGLLVLAVGTFVSSTVPAKRQAERELATAWGEYAACMVGGPLPADTTAGKYLHAVAVGVGPTETWDGSNWPERCQSAGTKLFKAARRSGDDRFLTAPLDRAALASSTSGADQIWQAAAARGFTAATPTERPPPRPRLLAEKDLHYFAGVVSVDATTDDGALVHFTSSDGADAYCAFGAACLVPPPSTRAWSSVPTSERSGRAAFDGTTLAVLGVGVLALPPKTNQVLALRFDDGRIDAAVRRGSENAPVELARDLAARAPSLTVLGPLDWGTVVGPYFVGASGEDLVAWPLKKGGAVGERILLRRGAPRRPHLSCVGTSLWGLTVQSTGEDDEPVEDVIVATANDILSIPAPLPGVPKAIGCAPTGVRFAIPYAAADADETTKHAQVDRYTCATSGCRHDPAVEGFGRVDAVGFAGDDLLVLSDLGNFGVHLIRTKPMGTVIDVALADNDTIFKDRRVVLFGSAAESRVLAGNDLVSFGISVPAAGGEATSTSLR